MPSYHRPNALAIGGVFDNPTFRHVANEATTEVASRNEQVNNSWRFGLVSPIEGGSLDSGTLTSVVSVAANTSDDVSNLRFGFENESAKLHMPTLLEWDRVSPGHARATLLALPGATEQLVDAWLKGLGVSKRRAGANGESSLLDRLEANREGNDQESNTDQLKALWFGGDLNQNYRLDPLELRLAEQVFTPQRSGARSMSSNATPSASASPSSALPPAWQRFVTWHSGVRNETRTGQPRVNLNEANLQSLHQKLIAVWPADWANFVIAMRQYGPTPSLTTTGETTPAPTENSTPDFSKPATYVFKSPLDLVGAVVEISGTNPQPAADGKSNVTTKRIRNPFSSDLSEVRNYLGRVLDACTTDPSPFTTGRVDVSEAPAVVLSGVPWIDPALAQRIVQYRSSNSGTSSTDSRDTIAWLLEGGVVDLARLKTIEPYITSRNDVYYGPVRWLSRPPQPRLSLHCNDRRPPNTRSNPQSSNLASMGPRFHHGPIE